MGMWDLKIFRDNFDFKNTNHETQDFIFTFFIYAVVLVHLNIYLRSVV